MSTTVYYFTLQTEPVLNQKANQRGYSTYFRQTSVLGFSNREAEAELPQVQASLDYTLRICLQFSTERLDEPARTGKCTHEISMIQDWHDHQLTCQYEEMPQGLTSRQELQVVSGRGRSGYSQMC